MNSAKSATPVDIEESVALMTEFYSESGYKLNTELSRQSFRKFNDRQSLSVKLVEEQ